MSSSFILADSSNAVRHRLQHILEDPEPRPRQQQFLRLSRLLEKHHITPCLTRMASSSTGRASCTSAVGTRSGNSSAAPHPSHTLPAVQSEIIYGSALQPSLSLHHIYVGTQLQEAPCDSLPSPIMVHPKECVQAKGTTSQ
jgi:hypothetical protein